MSAKEMLRTTLVNLLDKPARIDDEAAARRQSTPISHAERDAPEKARN
jgi:hypothetical protein